MSLKDVKVEDIQQIGARYQKVIEGMEEDRLEELRSFKGYPHLQKSLEEETSHSLEYIKYSLSRRFDTFNIVDLLSNLKSGYSNTNSLRNILIAWESFHDASRVFGATDELDLPYTFLESILKLPWECPYCKASTKFLEIIKQKDFVCTCGEKELNFSKVSNASLLLPSGFFIKTSKAMITSSEDLLL